MSADTYGELYSAVYARRWDHWSRRLWPFLRTQLDASGIAGGMWLDLCCGTGSLLRLADDAGFRTIGVDLSPHQLRHAERTAPHAQLVRADIREYRPPAGCVVVSCLFNGLNYITESAELATLLQRIAGCLQPRGLLVFDIETVAGYRQERSTVYRTEDELVVFDSCYESSSRMHTFQLTGFVRCGAVYRRFDECHVRRAYLAEEWASLLRQAGLSFRKLDLATLALPGHGAKRLVYVCTTDSH